MDVEQLISEASRSGKASEESLPPQQLTVEELAEKLRPQRLIGDYLYELTTPDTELARRILADKSKVLTTEGHEPPAVDDSPLAPKWVAGGDDRSQSSNASLYPQRATGLMKDVNGNSMCTVAMIGRSTALCAAHCFYFNGSWGSTGYISFGENNVGGVISTPFGTSSFNYVQFTNAWLTTAGAPGGAGNSASHSGWDWDFAIVEFAPNWYPGNSVGFYGTAATYDTSSYNQYTLGYPWDKPYGSQWGAYGGSFVALWGARQVHYIDIFNGNSGGCIRTQVGSNWYCTAIQSTHWNDANSTYRHSVATPVWNEGRDWDATTYNSFHSYAYSWPN